MLAKLKSRLKSRLSRFRRDEDGTVVVEAMIMFPTLMCAVLATFVFFDAFRNQSMNLKANYTLAEAVSREDSYITNVFMNNTWELHKFLTSSSRVTRMRISVLKYDATTKTHTIVWSRAKNDGDDYQNAPINLIELTTADIPVIPDGEVIIVLQTTVAYEPSFSIGLEGFTFDHTTYTRPRFTDNLCFSSDGSDANRICPFDSV